MYVTLGICTYPHTTSNAKGVIEKLNMVCRNFICLMHNVDVKPSNDLHSIDIAMTNNINILCKCFRSQVSIFFYMQQKQTTNHQL